MKLKSGIVIEKAGDEYVAVATGEAAKSFNGIIRNNKRANFLEHYDVSREKAQADVHALVVKIREAGLIDG